MCKHKYIINIFFCDIMMFFYCPPDLTIIIVCIIFFYIFTTSHLIIVIFFSATNFCSDEIWISLARVNSQHTKIVIESQFLRLFPSHSLSLTRFDVIKSNHFFSVLYSHTCKHTHMYERNVYSIYKLCIIYYLYTHICEMPLLILIFFDGTLYVRLFLKACYTHISEYNSVSAS